MFELDPHIHSVASGHAGHSTITDLARQAQRQGLKMLGITDHGPATVNSAKESYFRNLRFCEKKRLGIELLYGVELNILDYKGNVDLPDDILKNLDYAIISMHRPTVHPGTVEENTSAYINAMSHPNVRIVGHCDDVKYPADYEALLDAAMHNHVLLEINNASLAPGGYRGDTRENIHTLLNLCRKHSYPVILSSDSHGTENVGNFEYALEAVRETDFPISLIINRSSALFRKFLSDSR